MLLDGIKIGDLVIFSNGDEAFIEYVDNMLSRVDLDFEREVLGSVNTSRSWSYRNDREWIGGGNNIVKVIHEDGG